MGNQNAMENRVKEKCAADSLQNRRPRNREERKAIGWKIRRARQQKGLYQYELAEWTGVDSSHISMIECGKRLPSPELLSRLSTYLQGTCFDYEKIVEDVKKNVANLKTLKFRKNATNLEDSPTFKEIAELLSYHSECGDISPDDLETLLEDMRAKAYSALKVRNIEPYISRPINNSIEIAHEPVASR